MRCLLALICILAFTGTASAQDPAPNPGVPIYSAEGDHIGYIVAPTNDSAAYVAEISQPLGLGTRSILIGAHEFHPSGNGVRLNGPIRDDQGRPETK